MNIIFKETGTKKEIHTTHCEFKPVKGDYIIIYDVKYIVDVVCVSFGNAINKIETYLTVV